MTLSCAKVRCSVSPRSWASRAVKARASWSMSTRVKWKRGESCPASRSKTSRAGPLARVVTGTGPASPHADATSAIQRARTCWRFLTAGGGDVQEPSVDEPSQSAVAFGRVLVDHLDRVVITGVAARLREGAVGHRAEHEQGKRLAEDVGADALLQMGLLADVAA